MSLTKLHWLGPPPLAARGEDLQILSPPERARLDRLSPLPAARFCYWRAEMRRILGAQLNLDPRRVQIEERDGGKPLLFGDLSDAWHFNLSHSRDLALLVTGPRPLGVDLEFSRPRDFLGLASWAFRLGEVEAREDAGLPSTAPPVDLSTWFYRRWTRQEALFKLCGGDWITVQRHDVPEGEFLWEGQRVFMSDLKAPEGYFAALAESRIDPV